MSSLTRLTIAAALLASGASALATPITIRFDDTSGAPGFQNPYFTNRTGADAFYNWLTATNGGVTVTMRAGYWDGSGNAAGDYVVNNAGGSNTGNTYPRLGSYATGLGVTNRSTDGDHEIDNNGTYTDFVRFMFSTDVVVSSLRVRVYDVDVGTYLDTSYNVGDTPNGAWTNSTISGVSVGDLATVNIGSYTANDYFFFGAGRPWNNTEFKIREITFDDGLVPCIPPECGGEIPLPGTAGLLGLGAAALGFALRRRRQS